MINKTLYRPKLESGLKATLWSPCSVYTSSLIRQTHDGIMLEVDEIATDLSGYTTERCGQLEITASAITETVSELETTVSGNSYNIGQLEVTAKSIKGQVDEFISGATQPNLLAANGWMDKEETFVIPTDDMCYSANTSYIISQQTHLDAGTYCVSVNATKHFNLLKDGTTITPISSDTLSETIQEYNSIKRLYDVYTLETGDYKLKYGDQYTNSVFYRPKLEKGDHPTSYYPATIHYSSLIEQTAQEIKIQVEETDAIGQFKRTGLDITSGRIVLNADNTDINGNLRLYATNNSDALTMHDSDGVDRATVTSQPIGNFSDQTQDAKIELLYPLTWNPSYTQYKTQRSIYTLGSRKLFNGSVITPFSFNQGYFAGQIILRNWTGEAWQSISVENGNNVKLYIDFVKQGNPDVSFRLPLTKYTGNNYNYLMYYIEDGANPNVTITEDGTYNIVATVDWGTQWGTEWGSYIPVDSVIVQVGAKFKVESKSKTLLGADGVYVTNGINNYVFAGKDGFKASMASTGLTNEMASVGLVCKGFDSTNGTPVDTYTYTPSLTGPSHIALYNDSIRRWTSSQNYLNIESFFPSELYSYSQYPVRGSSDIIISGPNWYDQGRQFISLTNCEYSGHIIEYLGLGSEYKCRFIASSGAKFMDRNGNFSDSCVYDCNGRYMKLLFYSVSGTNQNGDITYNGLWIVLETH